MNKKGFTLTELLVVIVILGIISGLSIPLIRNLTFTFEKKKYQNYADSVLAASKVYNDSYSEDLFGYNEYGCAYISYEKLLEKNLIKDIQIADTTCNSKKTYVRVTKQQDKYGYAVFLTCGSLGNGKMQEEKISIPKDIPVMNEEVCTGVNESNLVITAVDAQTGGKKDKNRKKAKIKIESGTGINNNVIIYGKWSLDKEDHTNSGFEKITFKVKGDQESTILNGYPISTTSDEVVSPVLTGKYWLILRVDRLEDLYGHSWRNPDPLTPDSKYISFGPFMLDSTSPVVTTNVYKCDSSSNKTGNVLISKVHSGDKNKTGNETNFDLSNMPGTIDGWASSKNFPDGVCFEFDVTDDSALVSSTWQYNDTLFKKDASGYQNFPVANQSEVNHGQADHKVFNKSLTGNGHRYAEVTTKDLAGNKTEVFIDLKLDNKGPDSLTVTNADDNKWIKTDASVAMQSEDKNDLNKIGDYYYTYNVDSTDYTGTTDADAATKWVIISNGHGKKSFTATVWKNTMNKKVYIRSTDAVENISSVTKNTTIKIDKSKPIVSITNGSDEWHNTDVTLNLTARDNASGFEESGIDKYYYSYKSNATDYTGTTDADAATKWVRLIGGDEKTSFTTQAVWKTTMNKVVYIKVKDKVGNYSDAVSTTIKIDKTAPSIPVLCSSKSPTSWGQSITHTLSSSDNTAGIGEESGINKFQYKYGNNDWTNSTYNVSSGSGDQIIDPSGSSGSMGSSGSSGTSDYCATLALHGISCPSNGSDDDDDGVLRPGSSSDSGSSSHDFSSPYGYLATEIVGDDNDSSSSLDDGECDLNSAHGLECFNGGSSFGGLYVNPSVCPIEDDGTTTIHRHNFTSPTGTNIIYWRVCDNAGNCSNPVSTTMKIDRTSPKCSSSHSGTTVTFSCTDSLSGCSESTYSTEDPNGNGVSHTFYDKAGNSVRCGKEAGEPEDDEEEGGGGGGGTSTCTTSCDTYTIQSVVSSAATCSNTCNNNYQGYKSWSNTPLYRNGDYVTCTSTAGEGYSYLGSGCCKCKTGCTESCE